MSEVHADTANCCVMCLPLLAARFVTSSVYKENYITAGCSSPLTGPEEITTSISVVD